jgi:uncharacterized membrane protein YedE/YeeE
MGYVYNQVLTLKIVKDIPMNPLWNPALQALGGGVLIGLAAWLLLASIGRIAGISGIVAASLPGISSSEPARGASTSTSASAQASYWRWFFILGLVLGGLVFAQMWPEAIGKSNASTPMLIVAGLLVGVGTVLGSGCTSGHGVCGLGRLSLRSLVAVLVFMGTGMLTVTLTQMAKG